MPSGTAARRSSGAADPRTLPHRSHRGTTSERPPGLVRCGGATNAPAPELNDIGQRDPVAALGLFRYGWPMDAPASEPEKTPSLWRQWRLPLLLMPLTFASMLYVGAGIEGAPVEDLSNPTQYLRGMPFALPLMAILFAHEMGHYIAGRIHGVDISPPYFVPMPFAIFGTLGAVISMRGRAKSRNALLDVGASGPIAGLVVALPILIYGIATSPVEPLDPEGGYILEGHSLLYEGLLLAIKGPFEAGYDISLTGPAFAGWAGLLVTMINLVPFGQLDGGHTAYALFGPKANMLSKWVLGGLVAAAVLSSGYYGALAYTSGAGTEQLQNDLAAGFHWAFWAIVLFLMASRMTGWTHPPTDDDVLSPTRRVVAIAMLVLFALLFMPAWMRIR